MRRFQQVDVFTAEPYHAWLRAGGRPKGTDIVQERGAGLVPMWLIDSGVLPSSYVAAQGTAMGRAGRVHVDFDGERYWIGGNSVTCIEGTVTIG